MKKMNKKQAQMLVMSIFTLVFLGVFSGALGYFAGIEKMIDFLCPNSEKCNYPWTLVPVKQ